MDHELELFICGTRGTRPISGPEFQEFGGATVCYVVRRDDYAVVIDCGSGLYSAGPLLRDCKEIDVLISHLHYDHILGLLSYEVFPEQALIRFVSNFDRWFGSETLARFMRPPFWPYTPQFGALRSVDPPETFRLRRGCSVDFIPSNHPDDAVLMRLNISGRKLCFACDYEHGGKSLDDWVYGCDLLVYDGMYGPTEYPSHTGWGHSSWTYGCRLALENEVGCLLISHHGPNRDDETLRQEEARAQELFKKTYFARQGTKLIL